MFHYNFFLSFYRSFLLLLCFFRFNNHIIIFFILFFLTIFSSFIYFTIRNLFFFLLIFFLYARGLLLFFSYRIILNSSIISNKNKRKISLFVFLSFFYSITYKFSIIFVENINPFYREFTSSFRILFLSIVIFFLLFCLYNFLHLNLRHYYYKSKLNKNYIVWNYNMR